MKFEVNKHLTRFSRVNIKLHTNYSTNIPPSILHMIIITQQVKGTKNTSS